MSNLKPADVLAEVIADPAGSFEMMKIRNKLGQMVNPKANAHQIRLAKAWQYAFKEGKPLRILSLKPRQVGSSTFCVWLAYLATRGLGARGVLIADDYGNTKNLWHILRQYSQNDPFPWGTECDVTDSEARMGNGRLVPDTAINPKAGRSGTLQVLMASEVAWWPATGARAAGDTMVSLLNSISTAPGTIILCESTPAGANGWFYQTWQDAATLDNPENGNGWIKVFTPWFEFDEHVADPKNFAGDGDPEEAKGIALYGWTPEQVAWRRQVIRQNCNNDIRMFNQEYPTDDASCFLVTGRPAFDPDGVQYITAQASQITPKGHYHLTEQNSGKISVSPGHDGWLTIWEEPRVGCRYVVSADVATGADQTKGQNPDCHSVQVWRDQYIDKSGITYKRRLVARIRPPCRVAIDRLAWMVEMVSRYYGKTLVIVEVNGPGLALVVLVKNKVNLYRRQVFDMSSQKTTTKLGWDTTSSTRPMLIALVSEGVREQTLDIGCPRVAQELGKTVVHDNGKIQAAEGSHDDDVMSLGLALHALSQGTIYSQPTMKPKMPDDYKVQNDAKLTKALIPAM